MLCQEGASICANEPLFKFQACQHHVVMRDLCAECGANLRKEGGFCGERTTDASASIPMVHMIPELHVSESVAAEIALQDEKALLNSRKLVLLIDLDQTVLHTTIDGQAFRYKNVHRFRLPGCPLIYHTRFRPHLNKFLERISRRFQLHICTFGNRAYAHQLASILDPKRQYFCQRILSRDECFNPVTKSANLKALFPRGVHLVCIIDDRGDVWDWSPNLIHVQPYRFFPEVGDINGPPGRPLSLPPTPDFRPIPSELVTPPPSPSPQDPSVTSTSTASETPASEATTPPKPSDPPAEGASTKANELATVASTATDATAAESNRSDEPQDKDSQQRPKTVETPSHMASGVDLRSISIQRPETLFEMSEETLDSFDADYLLRLEQILLKIHRNYYRAYAKQVAEAAAAKNSDNGGAPSQYMGIPHVANIISQLRSKVLGPETHITLSGLTPTHRPASRCLAGQLAIGLGSTLHNRLRLPAVKPAPTPSTVSVDETSKKPDSTPETSQPDFAKPHKSSHAESKSRGRRAYTTHLVACRLNTEKVIAAQLYTKRAAEAASAGGAPLHRIHIVSPRWLWASHFRWEHLPEDQFPLDRDYLVSTFDPDVDSYPGSYRIGRRVRHFPAFAQPSICRQSGRALTAGAANSAASAADGLSTASSSSSATVSPTVDLLTVRSAIASIRAEEEAEAGGRTRSRRPPVRKRRRNHSEPLPSPVVVEDDDRLSASAARHHCSGRRAKRVCHRISDGELTLSTVLQASSRHMTPAVGDATTDAKCPTSTGALDLTSRSPSISMDEDDEEKENEGGTDSSKPGTDVDSPETSQEPTTHPQTPAPQSVEAAESAEAAAAAATAAQNEDVDVISDAGEDDLNSTTEETNVGEEEEVEGVEPDDGVDGTAGGTSRPQEEEEDIEAEMKNYLPPPCPLDLAENPLLHMPPQAASQMLTEIEEAVLEEQEERASSVPREMEIYDDDDDSSTGSSSTSSSSSQASLNGTCSEASDDDDDDDDDGRRGGGGYSDRDGNSSSRELDQEERWLQIRRQLLLRKRGPDHGELAEVEKKLERIKRGRQGSAESRLTVHTHSNRHAYSDHSLSHQHHHHHRHHRHYWTRRLHSATGSSPGIHSDPELSSNGWWGVGDQAAVAVDPVASALLDQRDWNTCPEGYDYEDAERARALLRPETRRNTTSGARRRGRKPDLISAAACLEGVTGLFGETSGSSDDDEDEKPTVDAAVNSSSSSSSSSTHEDDDEDDNEDLSVVTLEALKEFM
nr:unnamed protein product [Spirometra erinaceieuropaei]